MPMTRDWLTAWVSDRLDTYRTVGDRFAVGLAVRMSFKTVPIALAAMVLIHLVLVAFDALPYPLSQALAIGGFVTAAVTAAVTFVFAHAVGRAIQALSISRDEFERLSATDLLSGLANRRAFFKSLEDVRDDAVLAIFDIDRFKRINDTYGHLAGDEVIRGVARILSQVFAKTDGMVGRLGGEEFGVLLGGRIDDRGAALVDEARAAIAVAPITYNGAVIDVTVSAGVAELARRRDVLETYHRCDQALYCAKAAGRNRVVLERDVAAIETAPAMRDLPAAKAAG